MNTKNIMIVGVGGQGSLLASKLLGRLLVDEGYDVKVSEVHGMSQRGGSVVTYIRYGEKVYSPIITDGEVVYLSNRGCAGMATAGSGDVLAGILAGLCGYCPANAFVVAAGAFLAGLSGELAQQKRGSVSMLASDTVGEIANAIQILSNLPKSLKK